MAKSFQDCMVVGCTEPGRARECPGDHRFHHHGAIHTHPQTALDLEPSWGLICNEHGDAAVAEWEESRQRAGR